MDIGVVFSSLAAFFDGQFLTILIGTLLLFFTMFITWSLYRTLSQRNIFRLHGEGPGQEETTGDWTLYVLKFFVLFPILVFIGFLIFSLSLLLLIRPETTAEQARIMFIAIVMVSTIRVSSYVHELLAEDLAKLVPLSMLAILLTHPNLNLGVSLAQVVNFFMSIPSVLKYLVFTVLLEGVLRGGTWLFSGIREEEKEKE